nr:integrase, catalytic region, zinc finger, CCHC-type, peptidase aspartic, catalytic [Tanacetum cinerariifolium]
HEFHQTHRSIDKWTKNNPIEQVIGDPSKPVMTRRQLHTDTEVFRANTSKTWAYKDETLKTYKQHIKMKKAVGYLVVTTKI